MLDATTRPHQGRVDLATATMCTPLRDGSGALKESLFPRPSLVSPHILNVSQGQAPSGSTASLRLHSALTTRRPVYAAATR